MSFTDYVNDSVRILILLNSTKSKGTLSMTDRKVMLFDYYLKFPNTMLSDLNHSLNELQTLDEYYAFFHWQPDIIRYRQSLNYLIAKGFVEKILETNHAAYRITDRGEEAIGKIKSTYKTRMENITTNFLPLIIKLSDTRMEEQIRRKSNILLRNGSEKNETKIKD